MYNHLLFFGYWLINTAVLFLAGSLLPPEYIHLGSWRFGAVEACFYAGFFLTFLIWIWWDFALARKFDFDKKVTVFLFFLFVNYFSLLVVARFSYITGFEAYNYLWTFIIALGTTSMQRVIRRVIIQR